MSDLRIALAQLNVVVGDLEGNAEAIADAMDFAESAGADILVLPELAVTGYPPEDLLLADGFIDANLAVVERLAVRAGRCLTVVGVVDHAGPDRLEGDADAEPRRAANAVAVLADGRIQALRHKSLLPNYGVFDEARYFRPGPRRSPALLVDDGPVIGLAICEDLWVDEVADAQAAAGAQILVVANASPYHQGKPAEREALVARTARRTGLPVVYTNLVGGQDEIVFDGGSFAVDASGRPLLRLRQFRPDRCVVDIPVPDRRHRVDALRVSTGAFESAASESAARPTTPAPPVTELLDCDAELYSALVLGVRDYVGKNHFGSVIIGLSGGIDSALVATIAADALGADHVWGVGMPGPFSSGGSVTDAEALAHNLGIRFDVLPIAAMYDAALEALGVDGKGPFADTDFGLAEENLQARARGNLLMALSNKFGGIVLTTGNKSETAVGYATLYGDMAGGYAPIRDVLKTAVFALCRWRNGLSDDERVELGLRGPGGPIPFETLTKPPSAELAPGQRDDQSLPPYEVLDEILAAYVEQGRSLEAIAARGLDPDVVTRVVTLVDRAEYKRRQAPPGIKVTRRAFGRDRRLPITSGWHHRGPAG
ncbi:MAG TPA: NAD+ synthase [Acidimicrobiia bacterium]|nr:NAD+ synthase [Acidimicrobiia bacterium]